MEIKVAVKILQNYKDWLEHQSTTRPTYDEIQAALDVVLPYIRQQDKKTQK